MATIAPRSPIHGPTRHHAKLAAMALLFPGPLAMIPHQAERVSVIWTPTVWDQVMIHSRAFQRNRSIPPISTSLLCLLHHQSITTTMIRMRHSRLRWIDHHQIRFLLPSLWTTDPREHFPIGSPSLSINSSIPPPVWLTRDLEALGLCLVSLICLKFFSTKAMMGTGLPRRMRGSPLNICDDSNDDYELILPINGMTVIGCK